MKEGDRKEVLVALRFAQYDSLMEHIYKQRTRDNELLDCPYCGESQAPEMRTHEGSSWVQCNSDRGGCGEIGGVYPTREEACAAWNKHSYMTFK